MRKFVTLVVAALIVAGSYFVAFGVPASLGVISGIETEGGVQATKTAAGPQAGRPAGRSGGGSATTVVLTPLELQPYEDILRAIGSAKALHSADVVANASGAVTEINLAANRQVSAGDVLVQLEARTEVFSLEIAQTELDQTRDIIQRYERLQATRNSTVSDVTLSEARVAERLAEAKVGLAQTALDDRTIRAPFSGKLGLSNLEIGDILSAGSVVVTIDDSEALLVEFELPERSIGLLAKDQIVLASTPTFTGRVFEGEIVSFDSRIDSVTRSVTVKARIENPDALLWPGMTFAVRIINESDPLAVLPSTAITWSRSGSSVWIENSGVAEQIPVTILFRRDQQVWIKADIATGTMVVTEGAQKLRAGSRITAPGSPAQRPDRTLPLAGDRPAGDRPVGDRPAGDRRNTPEVGQADTGQPAVTKEPT
ncbi:efflux RND transporter periplasmic adaptor subunit [Oceaniovalibus sp. ACAM 378]|uniref:efflux RND transporter periplasmic adaptor subunit n=1 Tax=Oceaniovalibus sp. ACAM 378 TaxID=2599923 RepID=UPI0011D4138D|nr:efflux RND transporter periplasmic adaptor subunit [Oceaniovalibus sp. ACAM 378]TYB85770.1 efflux RND transporter periplasmic adaptor subunit [Oceaniovalibus sp. ACAM 378]